MQERRNSPRTTVPYSLEVYDRTNNNKIGVLVNLSTGGLLVVGGEPIKINRIMQLRIQIPKDISDHGDLEIGCESLWAEAELEDKRYWTGFQIIDISEEAEDKIANLVETYL